MPKTDLVPCFYEGQDDGGEVPAEILSREICHELKKKGEGYFACHGTIFRRITPMPEEILTRPRTLLPFGRVIDKLMKPPSTNYPIPAVRDYRMAWRHSFMQLANAENGQFSPISA